MSLSEIFKLIIDIANPVLALVTTATFIATLINFKNQYKPIFTFKNFKKATPLQQNPEKVKGIISNIGNRPGYQIILKK